MVRIVPLLTISSPLPPSKAGVLGVLAIEHAGVENRIVDPGDADE